jgi:hypothetical protein
MKFSTEIDNNFGYEKITQLVDNIPLKNTKVGVLIGISENGNAKNGVFRDTQKCACN